MNTARYISEDITIMLTLISLFAGVFFAWFFYLKARTKERTALIEKAAEGIDMTAIFDRKKRNWRFSFPWLKLGIIIVGICLGVAIGGLIHEKAYVSEEVIVTFAFMFGGIGMIVAHFTDRKKSDARE
jgi:uncharacterized membrane protein YsdA (DUF1294 family)